MGVVELSRGLDMPGPAHGCLNEGAVSVMLIFSFIIQSQFSPSTRSMQKQPGPDILSSFLSPCPQWRGPEMG